MKRMLEEWLLINKRIFFNGLGIGYFRRRATKRFFYEGSCVFSKHVMSLLDVAGVVSLKPRLYSYMSISVSTSNQVFIIRSISISISISASHVMSALGVEGLLYLDSCLHLHLHFYSHLHLHLHLYFQVDRKKPHPPGGFPIYVPSS